MDPLKVAVIGGAGLGTGFRLAQELTKRSEHLDIELFEGSSYYGPKSDKQSKPARTGKKWYTINSLEVKRMSNV